MRLGHTMVQKSHTLFPSSGKRIHNCIFTLIIHISETELAKLDEKSALEVQLEEQKRKCEEFRFRFEKESVNKDDIQKHNTTYI